MTDHLCQDARFDWRAFVKAALDEAHLGPGGLRRFIRENPGQARRRDAQGRTLYMQMLDQAGKLAFNTRMARNMAAIVTTGRNRWLCSGIDKQGRSLWPYLLRSIKYNSSLPGVRNLAQAVRSDMGDPASDRSGRGVLEQVLLHPDGSPWRMGGWHLFSGALETVGGARPDIGAWLPDIDAGRQEALMGALVEAGGRYATDFVVDAARIFCAQGQSVPAAWRRVFFNASLLLVGGVHAQAHSQDTIHEVAELGRAWMAPDTPVHEKVRDLIASRGLVGRWNLELARGMIDAVDVLIEVQPRRARLLGGAVAAGRRHRA